MSKQKQPFVPKIGQKVYIKRQNSLGETIYFEGVVNRIRVEVKCKLGNFMFMTVASPHTLETKAKGFAAGGDLF